MLAPIFPIRTRGEEWPAKQSALAKNREADVRLTREKNSRSNDSCMVNIFVHILFPPSILLLSSISNWIEMSSTTKRICGVTVGRTCPCSPTTSDALRAKRSSMKSSIPGGSAFRISNETSTGSLTRDTDLLPSQSISRNSRALAECFPREFPGKVHSTEPSIRLDTKRRNRGGEALPAGGGGGGW